MKYIFSFLLPLAFFVSCAGFKSYKVEIEDSGTKIFTGEMNRELFQSDDYLKQWYEPHYVEYSIDHKHLTLIDSLSKNVQYKIFLGTWCSDSKREIPHLFKILDSANVSGTNIFFCGLNRQKKCADSSVAQYHITLVPTIIVCRGGQEIGRIIESPQKTLEEDIVMILKR